MANVDRSRDGDVPSAFRKSCRILSKPENPDCSVREFLQLLDVWLCWLSYPACEQHQAASAIDHKNPKTPVEVDVHDNGFLLRRHASGHGRRRADSIRATLSLDRIARR
jgi:hypothetical protein